MREVASERPFVIDALRRVDVLSTCQVDDLAAIDRVMNPVALPAGTHITREGEPRQEFAVIAEGTAEVVVDGRVVARLEPGDTIGAPMLHDDGPRTATVVARSDVRLFVVHRIDLTALLASETGLRHAIEAAAASGATASTRDEGHP